ncbi:hypothetical protein [Belliella filtrata]|uniref:hypothetical protein n=1 Tax=Belliella filtrata TaxID=2923435 RepID=UPI001F4A3598|nr:hypothetical protein [Belliella filtrata]
MRASISNKDLFAFSQLTLVNRVEGETCFSSYQLRRIFHLKEIQRNIIKSPV